MSWLVILSGKVKRKRAAAKASLNRAMQSLGMDAKRDDLPLARRSRCNSRWRSEPVLVENSLDELRVGVKG